MTVSEKLTARRTRTRAKAQINAPERSRPAPALDDITSVGFKAGGENTVCKESHLPAWVVFALCVAAAGCVPIDTILEGRPCPCPSTLTCCEFVDPPVCLPPRECLCGNQRLDPGEACDDGSDNGRHGHCQSDCSGPGPACGDGVVNGNNVEVCDDGPLNSDAWQPEPHCNARCDGWVPPACPPGTCSQGSACDEGFCRKQCATDDDCPFAVERCVASAGGRVCAVAVRHRCRDNTDCALFNGPPSCDVPQLCQGQRATFTCNSEQLCERRLMRDDSGCTPGIVAKACGPYRPQYCTGAMRQSEPVCLGGCATSDGTDPDHAKCDVGALCRRDPGGFRCVSLEGVPLPLPGRVDGRLGTTVFAEHNTLVVGVPAEPAAYVFAKDATGAWTFSQRLSPSEPTPGSSFGISAAITADRIAIGAPIDTAHPGVGQVHIFRRAPSGVWEEDAPLTTSDDAMVFFGFSVVMGESHLVVSGVSRGGTDPYGDTALQGDILIYEPGASGTWRQVGRFSGNPSVQWDSYGLTVAMDPARIFVGAPAEHSGEGALGAVYIYQRSDTGVWERARKLQPERARDGDLFGFSVASDDPYLVVGDPRFYDVIGGAVFIYQRDARGRYQRQQIIRARALSDPAYFGKLVALDNGTLVVGSDGIDPLGASEPGTAYLFWRDRTKTVDPWVFSGTHLPASSSLATGTVDIDVNDGQILVSVPGDTTDGKPSSEIIVY